MAMLNQASLNQAVECRMYLFDFSWVCSASQPQRANSRGEALSQAFFNFCYKEQNTFHIARIYTVVQSLEVEFKTLPTNISINGTQEA